MSKPQAKAADQWHPEQIKAAVRMRGTTLSQLARDAGLHDSACRKALLRPSPAGEEIISAFLGVALHKLWPERYSTDGRRFAPRHVRAQNRHVRDGSHRLIAGAR